MGTTRVGSPGFNVIDIMRLMSSGKPVFSDYLYPVYSSLLVGLVHYGSYIVSSVFIKGMSLPYVIHGLISGGYFFVIFSATTWFWGAVMLTPVVLFLGKRKKINRKLMIMNIALSFLLVPSTIALFFVFHLLISARRLAT